MRKILATITVVLCIFAAASHAQEVFIGVKFVEGASHTYRNRSAMDSEITIISSGEETATNEFSTSFTQDVVTKSVVEAVATNGEARVRNTIETCTLLTRPPVPVLSDAYRALSGKSVVLTHAPDGQIRNVEGLDELFDQIMSETNGVMRASVLRRVLTEEFFKKLNDASNWLPNHAVKVGEGWSRSVDLDFPMPDGPPMKMKLAMNFKLTDLVGNQAYLDISGNIALEIPERLKALGIEMKLERGDVKGHMVYDTERSVFLRAESTGESVMSISAEREGESMSTTIRQNSSARYELIH
jgi:hypothetical protein